jgi:hypothetical protein
MEEPLNGTSDGSHIVRRLACAESKSARNHAEIWMQHKPDFKLAPGQKQVVSQDIKYGKPWQSDVLYTQFVFGSCQVFQRIRASGDDMQLHARHSAQAIVQIY